MNVFEEKLKEPFPPEYISWRVGATTGDKSKGIPLAYIDARDVMQRLDDVVGIGNWQCRYPFKGCCEIGIIMGDEWIWKANGAGETQVEADKGQYSDAFKRAAGMWGIGRYLYDVENKWVPIKKSGRSYVIENPHSTTLVNMLEKAAKGIRVKPEPEPEPKKEPKKETTPLDKALEFASKAETAIKGMDSIERLDAWQEKNKAGLDFASGFDVTEKSLQACIDNQYKKLRGED